MSKARKMILLLFYIVMTVAIVATYPSMGSLILLFAAMMGILSLLWQKFLTNRDNGGFDDDV